MKRHFCLTMLMTLLVCGNALADSAVFNYAADRSSVLENPYTGLAVWANDDSPRSMPFSLVYANLTWADFEPEEGIYDFETFEEANHLDAWRKQGKKLILRFVLDMPGSKKHRDIPNWLYEQTGDGQAYSLSYGKGYCPNYENPTLIAAHAKAIAALGQRYGNDSFLAFVELGSIGHWGEWHIHDELGQLPALRVLEKYAEPYLTAFPHAFFMTRRPFAFASQNGFGLYNDSSARVSSTEDWLEWIHQGGDYQGEQNALLPMSNAWKTAPIGGELASDLDMEEVLITDFQTTCQLFSRSHTSWIGPHTFLGEVEDSAEQVEAVNRLLTLIGYRLRVDSAQLRFQPDGTRSLTLQWYNDGIAPFYFDGWDAVLRLTFSDGRKEQLTLPMDIRGLLPGQKTPVSIDLPQGDMSVDLSVLDPDTALPGIRLAMDASEQDGWVRLFSLKE